MFNIKTVFDQNNQHWKFYDVSLSVVIIWTQQNILKNIVNNL